MSVYNNFIVSTLLCGRWKDKVPNNKVLSRAGLPTMFTLLWQRRLRWLGHVHRMEEGRIPKDFLHVVLTSGKRHWSAKTAFHKRPQEGF
ncbi:hypothetical protein ACOMHN_013905 [Nucella lapillus]